MTWQNFHLGSYSLAEHQKNDAESNGAKSSLRCSPAELCAGEGGAGPNRSH